ncbi:MAG: sugar ABC transporter permease [Anaerolineae bacterium]|nr:sugar ABC transporter permease [Anaerolineae bacterium]
MVRKFFSRLEPWLFLAPALFFLVLYLVYPAIHTFILSFFDPHSQQFVGLHNYVWAVQDTEFLQSIRNNLLWLIAAPLASIVLGFIIAALADSVGWGTLAKSLIFMPMAISFVGASVIWKFVYDYRGPNQPQIGILNALVVALGGEPQAWVTLPFWNNLFLIVVLVWMQTGFAVVMFSAAMRGVPAELIESARIDGASEIQVFTRIILPQIWGTILVVWTTFTVDVLKVFDIVLAMTNGQWDTNVLANMMYNWMFRGGGDFGRGSMLATVIMIAVIPIMLWNIRRFRAEETLR